MYRKHPDSVSVRLRFCRTCGVALPSTRTVFCADCRPSGYTGANGPTDVAPGAQKKFCAICGRRLVPAAEDGTEGGLRFCRSCRIVYQEIAGKKFRETGRIPRLKRVIGSDHLQSLRMRLSRQIQMSGDQIAAVAQSYERPYDSYGKLRAYIEEYDQLPPERFLKARREHPVVETLRGMDE